VQDLSGSPFQRVSAIPTKLFFISLLNMGFSDALLALSIALLPGIADGAAISVGPHSMKMHLEWNKALKANEWDDWRRAFDKVDIDGDRYISRHDITRLFKEHYTIIYDEMHHTHKVCLGVMPIFLLRSAFIQLKERFTRAEEHHFLEDAESFARHATNNAHPVDLDRMAYEDFHGQMHRSV
jgi:hypothetical protein